MANKAFSDTKLAPVGRFHFLRVGDWVYVFEIGEEFCEPTKDYVVEILETFKGFTAASRVALICGLLEIRLKLTAFEDLKLLKDRERHVSKRIRSGLERTIDSIGGSWGDTAVRLISGLAKLNGVAFEIASAQVRDYLEKTRLFLAINESEPLKPKLKPQIRSLKLKPRCSATSSIELASRSSTPAMTPMAGTKGSSLWV